VGIFKILKMGVIFKSQHPLLRAPVETKGYKSVIYLPDERIIRAYPMFLKSAAFRVFVGRTLYGSGIWVGGGSDVWVIV